MRRPHQPIQVRPRLRLQTPPRLQRHRTARLLQPRRTPRLPLPIRPPRREPPRRLPPPPGPRRPDLSRGRPHHPNRGGRNRLLICIYPVQASNDRGQCVCSDTDRPRSVLSGRALCRLQRAIIWLSGQGTISERNFPVPISGVWSLRCNHMRISSCHRREAPLKTVRCLCHRGSVACRKPGHAAKGREDGLDAVLQIWRLMAKVCFRAFCSRIPSTAPAN